MTRVKASDPGIYEIRNIQNGKRYVGQSVQCARRWYEHRSKLRKGTHCNRVLQRAWNLYGETNFKFLKLESTLADKDDLAARELFHMAEASEYNIVPSSISTLGMKWTEEGRRNLSKAKLGQVVTEEARRKISASLTGRTISDQTRQRLSSSRIGIIFSDEHRARLSASHKGHKPSEETRLKMSLSRMGNTNAARKVTRT